MCDAAGQVSRYLCSTT